MKNFIQRETLNFTGNDLEDYCRFLGDDVSRNVSAGRRAPGLGGRDSLRSRSRASVGFAPAGPERATARVELEPQRIVEAVSGIARLPAAAARRQRVPGLRARRVHDAARSAQSAAAHVARSRVALRDARRRVQRRRRSPRRSRQIVHEVFEAFESGSIQQLIHQMGTQDARRDPADRGDPSRSEQPHVGYDCRARRRAAASTPMRGRRTGASG